MLVIEDGISILVSPLQSENALYPIPVTEEGTIVFLQPLINVLLTVSIIALQYSLES